MRSLKYADSLNVTILKELNKQQEVWSGQFGDEWADRLITFQDAYRYWEADSRTNLKELLQFYFSDVPKNTSILEIGCGPGWILKTLQDMNFNNLLGIDINQHAIDLAKSTHKDITFVQGTAEDIQVYAELIITSAFLIHIHPDNLDAMMKNIYNNTQKYIFGRELSTSDPNNFPGGEKWKDLYWTRRFKWRWLELFPELKTVKYETIPFKSRSDVVTEVYLLEK